MNREDLKRNTTYEVKGEGIKKALLRVDNVGNIFYGCYELMNPIECFTKEFQEKIFRNIIK